MKPFNCLLTLLLIFSVLVSTAQDKNDKFNKITPQDFTMPVSAAIDSNTNAIIIADAGVTTFKGNNQGWVSYVFKRRTRIMIINKKAFDLATVKIHLYTQDDDKEKMEGLSATTYNLENGAVVPVKMEKNDLYTDKIDKNRLEQKFTLPAVKENSIIEYSYTINSDFYFNIPEWEFQNAQYPCLWSEYEVTIPSLVGYVFTKRGVHPFFIDKASDGHDNYSLRRRKSEGLVNNEESITVSANTVKHRWAMKDIPAFYVENYLYAPENYIDKIDFQLAQTYDGQDTHPVKNSWTKFTQDMLKDKDFALFVTEERESWWLDRQMDNIIKNNNSQLDQAKDIYYYITSNFTCTNYHNKYIKTTLQDVFKNRKGAVGEINLLLTSILLRKNIHAAPVLLSTRQYGYNYASYPILDRLDYVVCKATIGNKIYYLDASRPQLGFGHLPPDCYNGHARVIDNEDSVSVYFMADSIKEMETTLVSIVNDLQHKGGLEGSFEQVPGIMGSYELREAISGSDQKKFFDKLKTASGDELEITDASIDSLKQLEEIVKIKANFRIKPFAESDIIYFSPILWSDFKTNPFHAAIRKYPVEMSYPIKQVYLLNMETPEGFVIEEMPKSTKVSFNEGEGSFEYLVQKNEYGIQLRCSVIMKKAVFDASDYDSLRDFFGFIVKKQSEQIVFKRKK